MATGAQTERTGGSLARTAALTALAMLAFAANSVLCRMALAGTAIDPASFTAIRILSGALVLWAILAVARVGGGEDRAALRAAGSWSGALTLLAYAAAFSFAYVSLPAGTGALLLFGAVQATMVVAGLLRGERLRPPQWAGLALALAGLAVLVAPGVAAPPPLGAALMTAAGIAWGLYSLQGRASRNPLADTAGNFARATPAALALAALWATGAGFGTGWGIDRAGTLYAMLSGALASGVGYALWYAALPMLTAARAASVQLSVPILAAFAGVVVLGEPVTAGMAVAATAVVGGIALVIAGRRTPRP